MTLPTGSGKVPRFCWVPMSPPRLPLSVRAQVVSESTLQGFLQVVVSWGCRRKVKAERHDIIQHGNIVK